MKPRLLLIFLFPLVFALLQSGAYAQYANEVKPNQGNLSNMQSDERGFGLSHKFRQAKRPRAKGRTLIGDTFSDSIKNLFDNQGFTTYETLQNELEKQTPRWPQTPKFDFPTTAFYQRASTKSPSMAPLILPEVMQAPKTTDRAKPRYDPFRSDPSLIPPHLLAPDSPPNDASDQLKDLLPPAHDSPEEFQNQTAFDNLPVLLPPKSEIKEATPALPAVVYQAIPMVPSRPLFPPLPQQTVLSEEQRAYNRGLDAFRYRNYIKARQTFSDLAKISPDSANAQFGYGMSLFYAGEYEASLQALGNGYRIAKQNGLPEPTVWDLNIDPSDFRFYHKKLTRYVTQNRQDKTAGTLLFLLTHAGVMPPKNP
jgi:tetratricopeptide (TPR) repeat protein